jgi:glycosyltransferase involved in cell wall biosynthesis
VDEGVKPCAVIPVYNHGSTVGAVVRAVAEIVPVILVDDGSDDETKRALARAVQEIQGVTLVTRAKNGGKGAAMRDGFEKAEALGFTHALQIDADGQHDSGRARFFLSEAAKRPGAVICGLPQFDDSCPVIRLKGRKISAAWARVVTLSKALPDVHCGFRVYPVAAALGVMRSQPVDRRMGFDTEILVRLYWQGTQPVFFPVKIVYPPGGISNFRAVRDNARISWAFTRLFFGMLLRLPALLTRGGDK